MNCFWPFVFLILLVYIIWIMVPCKEKFTPFGSLGRSNLMNPYYRSGNSQSSNYFSNLYFPQWAPYGGGNYSYRSLAY